MWKTISNNGDLYMIRVTKSEEIEVYLNDLQDIWFQEITEDQALQQFQRNNPLIDVKRHEVIEKLVSLVEEITDETHFEFVRTNDSIKMDLRVKVDEFDVGFQFSFTKATRDVFLKEFTVPMIKSVKYLEEQQRVLCNLIQRKDRELEEYRLEKGEISRGDLKTEKFGEALLQNTGDVSMLNVFGSSQMFWDGFVEKYGETARTIIKIDKNPWNNIKRRRKVYSSKTASRKGKGINYVEDNGA